MKPFAAPVEDILFCVEAAGEASTLEDWDADFAREILSHFASFAEGEIAPIDEIGDRQGCRLENGRVRMPDGFGPVYNSWREQGWPGLTAPEAYGGQGFGPLTLALTSEVFSGACQSLQMVTALVPGAVRTLMNFGTEDQRQRFIPPMASGKWLSTMALTEPGAGSDLSCIRTRAEERGGKWFITGEKIFISGGDQDMSDGIFHLVLARTSDEGVKGLSLFACTSELADGSRNHISVARIEEKMGLHASPTCQLVFEEAEGELVGKEGQGLLAMFTMMNHARGDVALQGVAHSARSFDVARSYASERQQGRKADGTPATLLDHADVARMVDRADALTLGGRAITHLAFVVMEKGDNPDLVEWLTPIAKVYCTDAGIEAANLGIQVLGGYGYLREYRLDQTARDVRIAAIYEGANGIHERMLATRLLKSPSAEAFETFIGDEIARGLSANLSALLKLWREAKEALLQSADSTPAAHDFMGLTSLVLLEALFARMAAKAELHPEAGRISRVAANAMRDHMISAKMLAERVLSLAA